MANDSGNMVRCPSCGVLNRVRAPKPGERAKCGKCKAVLNLGDLNHSGPVVVNDGNFSSEVLSSSLPVLLDCWAPWCGPCRQIGPIIDQLSKEWRGKVKTAKLNVDDNPGVAGRFQIRSIPTLLVFHQGQLKDTIVGAVPRTEIVRRMAPWLG